MDIEVFNLPMDNERDIERTAYEIQRALRDGADLPQEELDWFDWANNHLIYA